MSAFMVTDNHLGALVRWYLLDYADRGRRYTTFGLDRAAEVLTLLAAENAKSVNTRYPLHAPEVPTVFADDWDLERFQALTPVQVIKACQCLRYQSCEHDSYHDSPADRVTREIEGAAITLLPGYDVAPWGLEETPPRAAVADLLEQIAAWYCHQVAPA